MKKRDDPRIIWYSDIERALEHRLIPTEQPTARDRYEAFARFVVNANVQGAKFGGFISELGFQDPGIREFGRNREGFWRNIRTLGRANITLASSRSTTDLPNDVIRAAEGNAVTGYVTRSILPFTRALLTTLAQHTPDYNLRLVVGAVPDPEIPNDFPQVLSTLLRTNGEVVTTTDSHHMRLRLGDTVDLHFVQLPGINSGSGTAFGATMQMLGRPY